MIPVRSVIRRFAGQYEVTAEDLLSVLISDLLYEHTVHAMRAAAAAGPEAMPTVLDEIHGLKKALGVSDTPLSLLAAIEMSELIAQTMTSLHIETARTRGDEATADAERRVKIESTLRLILSECMKLAEQKDVQVRFNASEWMKECK